MTKSIPAILGIFTIAGTSFALTGCSGEGKTSFDTAMAALNGGTPLLGSAPAPATVVAAVESVAEPEPPAPVYERVCRIEWHRAGTMQVEVCENRLVKP